MNRKYEEAYMKNVVAQYHAGQSVAVLCAQFEVPRSTVYSWIRQFKKLKSSGNTEITCKDYDNLRRHAHKLEEKLSVIREANCSLSAPVHEKLVALEKLYGKFSVHVLCDALGVSRGTYYNHVFRRKKVTQADQRRATIQGLVKEIFDESKQRFGAKKIRAILAQRDIKTSTGYVGELMREMNMESIGRHSKRDYKKQNGRTRRENILQQMFDVKEPNRVWASDTTCFKLNGKYYYVCVIIDLFSRRIVGHNVSPKHSTYLITSTLRRALESRNHPKQLTFHSDQGVQYTSKTFRTLLRVNNIVQSFSRPGKPHDNAVAESFFSTFKKEELYRTNYTSEREFKDSVNIYIRFFNEERPHKTLKYKTPMQFEDEYEQKAR